MGSGRMDRRHQFALLSVEPLEDRFLLSVTGFYAESVAATPSAATSVQAHSTELSQPTPANESAVQQRTSVPLLSPSASKNPQATSDHAPQGQAAISSDGARRPVGAIPLSTSTLATAVSLCLQALFAVDTPHTTMTPDERRWDRSDDTPGVKDEDDQPLSSHTALAESLAANAGFAGFGGAAAAAVGTTSILSGALAFSIEQITSTGLASLGFTGAAAILPQNLVLSLSGDGLGQWRTDEGREAFPHKPEPQTFLLPSQDSARENPSSIASAEDPFADHVPIDLAAIQRNADALFEQLARLSKEWKGVRLIHELTPWLLAASVMGYEWIRFRRMRRGYIVGDEVNCDIEPTVFLAGDGE